MFRDKATAIGVFACLLITAYCQAQYNGAAVALTSADKHVKLRKGTMLTLRTLPSHPGSGGLSVPADRVIETTLDDKLDCKKCQPGDAVRLNLVYPIVFEIEGRQVRIPESASIAAHVAFVSPRDRQHSLSRIVIVADSIQWGDKRAALAGIVTSAREQPRMSASQTEDYHDRYPQPTNSMAVLERAHRMKGD